MKRRSVFVFLFAATLTFDTAVYAAPIIGPMLPFDKYGHLMNSGGQCAATSTINSFQFLVNQYPGVYGQTSLIPGGTDLPSARDKLNSGWDFNGQHRNGMAGCPGGLNFQGIWEAKGDWLDDFAPTQQR